MGLPKIDLPVFETKLISTGRKKIKYRPFTVKEEKILLIAQESDEIDQIILAIKQIIGNCCSDVVAEDLPMFDLEYLLLQIRGKSVNNVIEFQITDPETEKQVRLTLDIENVSLTKPEEGLQEVKINDEYTLVLKYPTIDEYAKILTMDSGDPLINYILMVSCLDKIVSEDEVHNFKEYSDEDIYAFVDNLSAAVIKGIEKFFENIPKLRHEMKYVNENGDEETIELKVPKGSRQAFQHEYQPHWPNAIYKELIGLYNYGCFELEHADHPEVYQHGTLPSHIVFTDKWTADVPEQFIKCKARLVAGGNFEPAPENAFENFSPTAGAIINRFFDAYCVYKGLAVGVAISQQGDIINTKC